jgi:hypothetical protein
MGANHRLVRSLLNVLRFLRDLRVKTGRGQRLTSATAGAKLAIVDQHISRTYLDT